MKLNIRIFKELMSVCLPSLFSITGWGLELCHNMNPFTIKPQSRSSRTVLKRDSAWSRREVLEWMRQVTHVYVSIVAEILTSRKRLENIQPSELFSKLDILSYDQTLYLRKVQDLTSADLKVTEVLKASDWFKAWLVLKSDLSKNNSCNVWGCRWNQFL